MTSSRFEIANLLHRELVQRGVVATCLTCLYWKGERCTFQGVNAVPPTEVLIYGCINWDDLPF